MSAKGYVALSTIALLLIAVLLISYSPEPASALGICWGDTCDYNPNFPKADYLRTSSCGGGCPSGYVCMADACCLGAYAEPGPWITFSWCEYVGCNPIGRTCNYNGVFEHYSNCNGVQVINDCVDVYGAGAYCQDGQCYPKPDLCARVSCNSPPSAYCSGSTRVYYNSPGTCSGGSCSYSTNSYGCPTSGCSGSWRQSGGCSGGSCYLNNVENCGSDYWGCSDSETRAYRSQGCSGGSCYGSWGSQQNCNNNNYCANSGSPYNVCTSSTTRATRQDRVYVDYGCSGGNCYVASQYASGNCPAVDSNPVTCSASSPTCSGTSRCTYSAGCSGGSCYNNPSCSACPTPSPACAGTSVRTYYPTCSGGNCGSTYSDSACPTPSPTCVGTSVRTYTATCSGASCGSTYSDSACPTPSPVCINSNTRRTYTATCSGASCSSTATDTNCPYGCSGGQCNNDPCSGVSCTSPPAAYCSGNTRVTYNSPGTCSGGTCSYSTSSSACPTTGCSGETRQTGGCSGGSCYLNNAQDCNSLNTCTNTGGTYPACNNGQACTAQNRVYNDYTCSGGGCALASSGASGNCPTVYSNCQICNTPPASTCSGNTRIYYDSTGSCSSGSCQYTQRTQNCDYGCSNGVCGTNPCSSNPCTNVPESTCSGNTLNVYAGSCAASGSSATCSYPGTPQACQYGCLSLPGNDQCASNSAPTFNSVSVSGAFGSYVRNTHTVSVSSSGSDPNGEQVKLKCGDASGNYNLCAGSLVPAGPTCSFTNSWSDSGDHTLYCALEDSAGATSAGRTSTISADNSAPSITLTKSPSGSLTPGTATTLTADASDVRSGVAMINIVVDGYSANQCGSTTCSYTFTPSYGTHTYYANAYDRVGNVAWIDGILIMPGPGPNGNGTSPPPGTTPGEGTSPLPLPSPVPGEIGSPCSNNNDCRSNVCSNSQCTAAPGTAPTPAPLPVNNPPTVNAMDFTPRGNCKQGSTITLQCTASDANQAANTLSVKGWAGTCTTGNCFATRSWTYLNNAGMTAPSNGDTFTKDITITAPEGTGIAATCQATDALGGTSNWGDAYPLCVVNNCPNPPTINSLSVTPNPSGVGSLTVSFTASRSLYGNPSVKIKPGSQTGGMNTRTGNMRQKNGNSYTFDVPIDANDANGIADVWIDAEFTSPNGNCQFGSSIQQITIDTQPPATTARCNGLPCSSDAVYTAPMQLTFGCSDATTSCMSTLFGVDSPASETYSGTRQITADGTHTINYRSNDTLGNQENLRSQQIRIFKPPCVNPNEEPSCNPSGFVGVELYAKLAFNKTNVVTGDDAQANLYCFLRTKDITKRFIRPCNPDPTKLSIIVDKGTAAQKDYFSPITAGTPLPTSGGSTTTSPSYTPPNRADFVTSTYQKEVTQNLPTSDGTYTVTRRWDFKLPTTVFQSSVCINVTDLGTGLSVEACGDYTVTESEFLFGAEFPDLGVTVPLTVDPVHDKVANFTKTMLINFTAVPSIRTASGLSVCEPPNCRVDFSFDTTDYDRLTEWDPFQNAFVAKNVADIASNNFACDQYKTLYLQAQQAGGPPATTSKEFFVNCDTKITVSPVERRFTLGDHGLNSAFTITVINPKEAPLGSPPEYTKSFDVTATTISTIFNMNWLDFRCTETGCTDSGDTITLDIPAQGQKSFAVDLTTVARSGSFPITFVAKDLSNDYTYSTTANILVFAEGLNEFATWQLIILVVIVIGLIAYYKLDLGHDVKKRKVNKKRPKKK